MLYDHDKGYLLGGLCWFAIPFALATSLGLAALALQLPLTASQGTVRTPSLSGPQRLSRTYEPTEPDSSVRRLLHVPAANAGLVPVVAAVELLGSTGGVLMLLMVSLLPTLTLHRSHPPRLALTHPAAFEGPVLTVE